MARCLVASACGIDSILALVPARAEAACTAAPTAPQNLVASVSGDTLPPDVDWRRVGQPQANIRVIAATNRDLRKAVERGEFREDLFYRLGVFDIRIPPLRERPVDIVPITDTFLQEIGRSFGRPLAGLTREARQALLQYDWPGNVRELRHVLERATILSEGALIEPDHLALQPAARSSRDDTTDLGALERTTIGKVLQECRGNKTKAARRLGVSRTQLHWRVRKYGLEHAATA